MNPTVTPDLRRETDDDLIARGPRHGVANYVLTVDPTIDDVARSLTDPARVLF